MQLYYYEEGNLWVQYSSENRIISLSGDEGAHLKVMRLKQGEFIHITDGLGNLCKAKILDASNKKTNAVELIDITSSQPSNYRVHIAVAPTKNIARFEWFLEKATEFGINEITPFYSEHSERIKLRPDRLNKILVSAMKQSLKTYLPVLHEPTSLEALINKVSSGNENKFIAWLDREGQQKHLLSVCPQGSSVIVLIGPEGDFNSREIELARAKGFLPVHLGKSRLRTETAALAACLIVNLANES
jgi:16S rRNA (uracil1498-N3)-methyltransferase